MALSLQAWILTLSSPLIWCRTDPMATSQVSVSRAIFLWRLIDPKQVSLTRFDFKYMKEVC